MRMRGTAMIALLAISCVLTACAGSGGGGGGGTPKPACKPPAQPTISFSSNIQPIFTASCALAGCHVGAVPTGPVDLSVGQTYAQTVNVKSAQQPTLKRFLPGKPDLSYIIRKIEGGPNIAGVQMPQGCPGAPLNGAKCLTPDNIAAIRQWVTECATNN